jgi:hypothetical protein
MISDNGRSTPVIDGHLPIEEPCGEYSSDRRKRKKRAAFIQQVMSSLIASSGE